MKISRFGMQNIIKTGAVFILAYLVTAAAASGASLNPTALKCEYLTDPLGIDERAPRLSWWVESSRRAEEQTAYQVLVASTTEMLKPGAADLWDSGKVASDDTIAIVYHGKPLVSGERCYWTVRVWDKDGKASGWSRRAVWAMGLLEQSDWKGEWIGYDGFRKPSSDKLFLPPPPYLRKTFAIRKSIRRATLYVTALGLASVHLNGHLVSEDHFTPGWTDYTKRVPYRTYDVTRSVRQGENALGVILGDGWYSGYIGWGQKRDHYGTRPRFRGQMRIDYSDGSSEVIASGPDWKASEGPVREADFLMGEKFDARMITNWDEATFDDSKWAAVVTGAEMSPRIEAHPGPPVRQFRELEVNKITQPSPGAYVFDLGQNFAGVAKLKVAGRSGQTITMRFAERLNKDGTIYTANLRGARSVDTYICRGGGVETWEPHLVFHGFQYVEVTGLEKSPTNDTITGIALSSDTPDAGDFSCSDWVLNRLAENTRWTQRANFIDIPTDCPQRDERLGWMGDAQVYIRAATLHNDVHAFFTKWLTDVEDGQRADGEFPMVAPVKVAGDDGGPGWADAGVICPWTLYEVYGDKRILERHYDSMARFIEFCKNRSTPELLPPAKFHCFGDWLNVHEETPTPVICTAFFAHSTHLLARAAEVLGKTGDAAKYTDLFERIKASFNRAYVNPDGRIEGDTQTGYALALAFDLLDPQRQKAALQRLVEKVEQRDWHLSTGFIGTRALMLDLAAAGRNDVASRLIHNDTYPSWGFTIKHGATSIWERWDGWTPEKGFQDPGMNSFAHYSFGAVYQWMVENIAGIRSDSVAFKHVVIAPYMDGKINWAHASYRSIRGQIETEWNQQPGKLTLRVQLPANTTATILIPAVDVNSIFEDGKFATRASGLKFSGMGNGWAVFEAGSGIYNFEVRGAASAPVSG
jgi:alpha-L-rhamnosidase